jgi:signal transduction histidine kinase
MMKQNKQWFLKLTITFVVFAFTISIYAQQSKVDSIIHLLEKSNTKKGIDGAIFLSATTLLGETKLDDTSIRQIENTSNMLRNIQNGYWSYGVKYTILSNLIKTDKDKAISYGTYHFLILDKSKTPNHLSIRSGFLKLLRLPYRNSNKLKEGFEFFSKKLKEYKQKNDSIGMADCYYVLGGFYITTGLIDQAIYNMKKSLTYMDTLSQNDTGFGEFDRPNGRSAWINNNTVPGSYYVQKGNYNESIKYLTLSFKKLSSTSKSNNLSISFTSTQIARAKLLSGQLKVVPHFLDISIRAAINEKNYDVVVDALQTKVLYEIKMGDLVKAEVNLEKCYQLIEENKLAVLGTGGTNAPDYYLALIRIKQNRTYEAIALLKKDLSRIKNIRLDVLKDYRLLGDLYDKVGDDKKAKEIYQSFISLQDSLVADQSQYRMASFETEQQMNEKELSITKLQSENKLSALINNFSIGIAALLLILAVGVYSRFRFKQKANRVLEQTLSNLKTTQTQLIQSEKMASLGELTAGIAHEIQNPLNFVNNFSEVSMELIVEMEEELAKGDITEAIVIANDVKQNLEKINYHGKRADSIVKGMLQHSRSGNTVKEPININALADEYLRLAYHGLRAKDKSFNADLVTNFDETLPKINVLPQDIGRVLLNLFTNAFYATHQKQKLGDNTYKPKVEIATSIQNNSLEIKVKDNGMGIPDAIKDKILQPFFTTKPTGEGTGLGLSLSYDIVVKGHGGTILIDSKEKEYTVFTLQLPIN